MFYVCGLSQRGRKGQVSGSLITSSRMISLLFPCVQKEMYGSPLKLNSPKGQMRKVNKIINVEIQYM